MKIERVVFEVKSNKIIHISSSGVREIRQEKKDGKWNPNLLGYLENYMEETGFEFHGFREWSDRSSRYFEAILIKTP